MRAPSLNQPLAAAIDWPSRPTVSTWPASAALTEEIRRWHGAHQAAFAPDLIAAGALAPAPRAQDAHAKAVVAAPVPAPDTDNGGSPGSIPHSDHTNDPGDAWRLCLGAPTQARPRDLIRFDGLKHWLAATQRPGWHWLPAECGDGHHDLLRHGLQQWRWRISGAIADHANHGNRAPRASHADPAERDAERWAERCAARWVATVALGFAPHDALCVARASSGISVMGNSLDWPGAAAPWPRPDPVIAAMPAAAPASVPLRIAEESTRFAPCPQHLGLYAVVPDAAWVARCVDFGVPTIQLRCKSADPAQQRREVNAAVRAAAGSGARLFINDHWQLALEAGAYGVHLGQEDLDHADLQAIRAAGMRLGLSTHGYFEIQRAQALAPSYIALGAIYPTPTKTMPSSPQGLARLAAYLRLLENTPTVAIGGIDEARIPAVHATGIGSIAVVRAITEAGDPGAAVGRMLAVIDKPAVTSNDKGRPTA